MKSPLTQGRELKLKQIDKELEAKKSPLTQGRELKHRHKEYPRD